MLRELSDFVYLCSNEADCIRKMENAKNSHIILILSGRCATKTLLKNADSLRWVDTILIFCMDKTKHRNLMENTETKKIIGLITNQRNLKEYIVKTIHDIENQLAVFAHYNLTKQKSNRNLNDTSGSFVWFQLIKGVMEKLSRSEDFEKFDAKKEMIDKLRLYYRNSFNVLEKVNEFEKEYTPDQALKWYTRNSFLFRMINRALRTENIEELLTYAFYITDLSTCLKEQCEFFRQNSMQTKINVYHGGRQPIKEIEQLKNSIGQCISVNSFFSTSRNRDVAKMFAGAENKDTNLEHEPILFKIQIDIENENVNFADIQFESAIKDEEEILFDFGSVFQIESVEFDTNENVWLCSMNASNHLLEKVQEYLRMKQESINNKNELVLLGDLLYEMNEFQKSKIYFEKLNDRMPDNTYVLFGLGRGYCALFTEYDQALKYLQRSLQICTNQQHDNSVHMAMINIYIGRIHSRQGKYHQAQHILINAIEQLKQAGMNVTIPYATALRFLGSVQLELGFDELSLQSFQETLDILTTLKPNDYPQLSLVYINIASSLYYMGKYDESFQSVNLAENIGKPVLPGISSHMALIHNLIGKLLYKKGEYQNALQRYTTSLEIYKQLYGEEKKYHFAACYNNSGKIFYRTNQYHLSEQNYNETLAILENYSSDNIQKAITLKNKAQLSLTQNDCENSLYHAEKAREYIHNTTLHFQSRLFIVVEIYRHVFPSHDHRNSAKCFHVLGEIYWKKNDSKQALHYYRKAYQIWKKVLINNHPEFILCLKNIVYLRFYQKCCARRENK